MMTMPHHLYEQLQRTAQEAARKLPLPALYAEHAALIRSSEERLRTHSLVRRVRASMDESALECAHGMCHCEAVARDAGVLVEIEGPSQGFAAQDIGPLSLAASIAGLLHDIKRREQNHALLGSIEAEKILSAAGMDSVRREYVATAIRNHEAFKEYRNPDDKAGRLVSNALYDADKLRWGPENFSTTLWLMVEANSTPPEALHRSFREKMKGIEQIKETFRTAAGRRYGPEFIDQGIQIGNIIYQELSAALDRGAAK